MVFVCLKALLYQRPQSRAKGQRIGWGRTAGMMILSGPVVSQERHLRLSRRQNSARPSMKEGQACGVRSGLSYAAIFKVLTAWASYLGL